MTVVAKSEETSTGAEPEAVSSPSVAVLENPVAATVRLTKPPQPVSLHAP